jgi:hypothetical protein
VQLVALFSHDKLVYVYCFVGSAHMQDWICRDSDHEGRSKTFEAPKSSIFSARIREFSRPGERRRPEYYLPHGVLGDNQAGYKTYPGHRNRKQSGEPLGEVLSALIPTVRRPSFVLN